MLASSKEPWGAAAHCPSGREARPRLRLHRASLSHQHPFPSGSGLAPGWVPVGILHLYSWEIRWKERSPPHLFLSVLYLFREMLLKPHSRVQVFEGAEDNLPDRDALRAALAIRQLAESLTADDLLLVLISGVGARLVHVGQFGGWWWWYSKYQVYERWLV